jgi:hypothetical protein
MCYIPPSKEWVYDHSFAGVTGSNPVEGMHLFVSIVRCQVEVSGIGRSLVQKSTECVCVTECDQMPQ